MSGAPHHRLVVLLVLFLAVVWLGGVVASDARAADDLTVTITKFKRIIKPKTDRMVVRATVINTSAGIPDAPVRLVLWLSDNAELAPAQRRLAEQEIDLDRLTPGTPVSVRFVVPPKIRTFREGHFAVISIERDEPLAVDADHDVVATHMIGSRECLRDRFAVEDPMVLTVQRLWRMHPHDCVTIEGEAVPQELPVDRYRVFTTGTVVLEYTLDDFPSPEPLIVSMFDVNTDVELGTCELVPRRGSCRISVSQGAGFHPADIIIVPFEEPVGPRGPSSSLVGAAPEPVDLGRPPLGPGPDPTGPAPDPPRYTVSIRALDQPFDLSDTMSFTMSQQGGFGFCADFAVPANVDMWLSDQGDSTFTMSVFVEGNRDVDDCVDASTTGCLVETEVVSRTLTENEVATVRDMFSRVDVTLRPPNVCLRGGVDFCLTLEFQWDAFTASGIDCDTPRILDSQIEVIVDLLNVLRRGE